MRPILILLSILICLAGFYLAFVNGPPDQKEGQPREAPGFFKFDPAQVTDINLTDPNGRELELARLDGAWRLIRPVQTLADEYEVLEMMAALGEMKSLKSFPAEDLAAYGLAEPWLSLDLTLGQNGVRRVELGQANPAGTGRYLRLDDRDTVHLIETYQADRLNKNLFRLRDKIILRPQAELVREVAVAGPKGRVKVVRGQAGWRLAKPGGELGRAADPILIDNLIGSLFSHRIKEFIDQPPQGQPDLSVEVIQPEATLAAAFWTAGDKPLIPGRSGRHDQAFLVERSILDRLDLSADELADRRLMVYDPAKAAELILIRDSRPEAGPAESWRLILQKDRNLTWRIVEPADRIILGQPLDVAELAGLIHDFKKVRYTSESEEPFAGPELTVLIKDRDGKLMAGLEVRRLADGRFIAKRPGDSLVFVINHEAFRDLPGTWGR